MTDALVTQQENQPEMAVPPVSTGFVPEEVTFPCSKCDKVFPSVLALQGHMSVHAKKKVPCPECGKKYVPGPGLASHRSKTHGVPGARMDKPSNRVKAAQARVDVYILNEDITVDDIFQGVLPLLFPKDTIPTYALTALLQWRDDTERMLKGITNGL